MVAPTFDRPTPAERLIVHTIELTWLLWLVGGLYIVGPALGWMLAAMAAWRLYAPARTADARSVALSGTIVAWLLGMAAMLGILIAGHLVNDLGTGQLIKSAVGWAKGWALLGLFPFAGAVLDIRPALIYRSVCRLGVQTLALLPVFLVAPFAGLPGHLYTSPFVVLGGSGPEFFEVVLYTFDPVTHAARWQFFAPWSPAAGMVAVVYILCAIEERDRRWKLAGVAAWVAIALFSQSRLALVTIAVVWPLALVVSRLRWGSTWIAAAAPILSLGLLAPTVSALIEAASARFVGARADSSRVRATLGRIAVERWRHEAPWIGHGIVERGPHIVEYMPIGSHHTWYGLLFVKGIAGAAALAVPLMWTLVATVVLSMRDTSGRVAFAMTLVLLLYSFGENLEVLAYLYWPALIVIGAAARRGAPPLAAAISA